MATESRNNSSALSQTPDVLRELVRRLRHHAMTIKNAAATRTMGQDMFLAALVIERQLDLPAAAVVRGLPANEAKALAEFFKRIGFEDCARFAATTVTYDGRSEADTIWSGVLALQREFAAAGYAPR